jgi:hypothetical protein
VLHWTDNTGRTTSLEQIMSEFELEIVELEKTIYEAPDVGNDHKLRLFVLKRKIKALIRLVEIREKISIEQEKVHQARDESLRQMDLLFQDHIAKSNPALEEHDNTRNIALRR